VLYQERAMSDRTSAMPRWVRVVALSAVALALSVFAWWPVLKALPHTQSGDGPPYHKTLEAARVTITRYHEFPHWNPYECGGLPLWDNPQAPLGAPLVWPMFLVGTTTMMAWWYVFHSALGFASMWLFARKELRLSLEAAMVASGAWAFAGFHQQHYSGGHFTFVPFLYFPLALLLWRRAAESVRSAILLGLLVAWMIYEGGVYPLPHLAAILAVETLTRVRRSTILPIVRAGAIVVVVGLTVGASRFLPVFEQLRAHTRAIGAETDALQWATFKDMFLARTHERAVAGQAYVWPEYGAYLGPIILLLALLGIALAGAEHLWMLVLLAFSVALMFGHAGKWAPWSFLKGTCSRSRRCACLAIPVRGDDVRGCLRRSRTRQVGCAPTSLAPAVRHDPRRAHRRALPALIGVGDVISLAITTHEGAFTNPPEQSVDPAPRLYMASDTANMIDQPRQNLGRLACWDEWGFGAGAPLWVGDVPQARAESTESATVTNVVRTPNTFSFDVEARAPSTILLNGTYDKGWRSNVGTTAERAKQLILEVPAGTHHVVVRYRPRTFGVAVALTVVGLAGAIGALALDARRRRGIRSSARTAGEICERRGHGSAIQRISEFFLLTTFGSVRVPPRQSAARKAPGSTRARSRSAMRPTRCGSPASPRRRSASRPRPATCSALRARPRPCRPSTATSPPSRANVSTRCRARPQRCSTSSSLMSSTQRQSDGCRSTESRSPPRSLCR